MSELKDLKKPEKWSFKDPYVQALCRKQMRELKPTIVHYVDHWAETKPNDIAIVEYDTGEEVTWAKFAQASRAFAARLLEYGLQKGDIIATSLPFLKEHIYLMFGCMRLGVIYAPLDLRLKVREINHCFEKIRPKMYFFLGLTDVIDFRDIVKEVMKVHDVKQENGSVKHWIQFQKSTEGILDGAVHVTKFAKNITYTFVWNKVKEMFGYGVYWYEQQLRARDPCCIIFTTGSTGAAKPALLHHEGILLQTIGIEVGFFYPAHEVKKIKEKDAEFVNLVNLPPSHVAGLTEELFTGIKTGAKNVVLHVFGPKKTLDAIQKYRVSAFGQIPACFNLEWALEDYEDYDLSSLEMGIYGGQSVSREFVVKMTAMAKRPGSSYGMTELNGCVTFTDFDTTPDEIMQSVGYDTPCCRITIRQPMREDGMAGEKIRPGEVGEICCEGPMIFAGYVGMPEKTRECVCEDEEGVRVYYTGDLGSYDDKGLHFQSRRKFVMKPKGFQVFPGEVEDVFLNQYKDRIQFLACVGVEHKLYSQGIVAVMKYMEGAEEVPIEEMKAIAKEELASYKRPALFVVIEDFPLNRSRKKDYMAVTEIAKEHVKKLQQEGGWDGDKK